MPRELYHWNIHLNGDLWGETERESIFWPHFLLISQETWKVSIVESELAVSSCDIISEGGK